MIAFVCGFACAIAIGWIAFVAFMYHMVMGKDAAWS